MRTNFTPLEGLVGTSLRVRRIHFGATRWCPVGGHKASVQLATTASIRTSMSSNPSVDGIFRISMKFSIEQ